jgi:hypothetical protein
MSEALYRSKCLEYMCLLCQANGFPDFEVRSLRIIKYRTMMVISCP